jgi:hypothetical protein
MAADETANKAIIEEITFMVSFFTFKISPNIVLRVKSTNSIRDKIELYLATNYFGMSITRVQVLLFPSQGNNLIIINLILNRVE